MKLLDKRERSSEINKLERILIDFKPLIDNKFTIFKKNGTIYYFFDENGFTRILKTGDFLYLEDSLNDDQFVEISYTRLKKIVSLKKSEITKISYDDTYLVFETTIEEKIEEYEIEKENDTNGALKRMVALTSKDTVNSRFIKVEYDRENQLLRSIESGRIMYPFNISFSYDIVFKLKTGEDKAQYFLYPLAGSSFIEVITTLKYSEVYEAQSILFVFNYFKKTE